MKHSGSGYLIANCCLLSMRLIWYRVLPQGERQFVFAIRVGCVVVWPIFSTSKMKTFCIYFYKGNITFKNIINLVSFIINIVEYLVINSYSVTVLDNFRKETSDRAKRHFFWRYATTSLSFRGIPPTSMVRHLGQRFDEGITLTVWVTTFFYSFSTGKRALQLLLSCMALSTKHSAYLVTYSLYPDRCAGYVYHDLCF